MLYEKLGGKLTVIIRDMIVCERLNVPMRALFVAEKNDAAKSIAAILSRGTSTRRDGRSRFNKIYQFVANVGQNSDCYVAMTSVSGHLLQHSFPASFKNWTETPIKMLFDVNIQKSTIPGMEDVKATLVEEIRKSDLLVIWTDCDREGEAIGAEVVSVCTEVNRNLDVYRARFSEITNTAVNRALNNLVRLDQRLVDAVECRSELDLRIGAAFTRLQTLHLRNNFANIFRDKNIVSYGSCQFPTLGFIVERYQAIKEFISETFWKISMKHTREDIMVEFVWDRQRLFDRDVVQVLLDDCEEAREARVLSVIRKPKSKWRPVALDTVELEKLAVRKLKFSAKETMVVAERLYNKGYISYPRTETNKFPKDIDLNIYVQQQTVSGEWGEFAQEVAAHGPSPRNGSKTDEAHPPIHPLKFATTNELIGLEWSLYEFIVRHFLACLSVDAKGQETKVQVRLGNENFTASGLIVEDYGYLNVYKYDKWGDKILPSYRENEIITDYQLQITEGQTQPPQLLNEADLIALMDKYGIGTDATHAEHIETIKTRQYAALNSDGRFVPGYIGLALVDGYDRMGYAMSKPHMRADLESQLKLICLGQRNRDDVLREQIARYRAIFEQAEDKVQMLSNALRQYLNQRENLPETTIPENEQRNNLQPPNNTRVATGRASLTSRNTTSTRRGRSDKSGSRGASRSTSRTVNSGEQLATTNANDIELLSSLSILHSNSGTRGRKKAITNAGGGCVRGRVRAVQGRQCSCGKAAKRLIVKKEGPNHGRTFWICPKGRDDPEKCKYFEWDGPKNNEPS
ncbi:DNA topoisomerase III [Loa loa]|uniref:DNA topoisomerase n=1 Tax=Loa loa TaxID=7209 RepID=A0A1S0U4T9_LOALO|nr:DNA topoisomerase III [Loa loa]EFO25086.1 DNA topoisomerase III [Loa loa]